MEFYNENCEKYVIAGLLRSTATGLRRAGRVLNFYIHNFNDQQL